MAIFKGKDYYARKKKWLNQPPPQPNMFVEWEKLLALKYNLPLEWLGFELTQLRDHIYKLDDNQYILAENFTYDDNRPKYFGFVWTASEGIAGWIFMKNSLADDGANICPPACLLPAPGMTSYTALVEYGRQSNPENFDDTVYGQTRVTFGDYTYFFRKCIPAQTDYPIAIEVDRRTDKRFFDAH
jgi:hypothetical protein